MPISNPDALITKGGILNTRTALHVAVTRALKEEGLDPFPKTRMTLGRTVYFTIVGATEQILKSWGTPFKREQIMRELSRRGYDLVVSPEVETPTVVALKKEKGLRAISIRDVAMIALPLVGLVGMVMLAKRRR